MLYKLSGFLIKRAYINLSNFATTHLSVFSASERGVNMACQKSEATLSMGPQTMEVPLRLFLQNRQRLTKKLQENAKTPSNSLILLQGGDNQSLYDTDVDYVFRQESYFMWLWGVLEPGCYGALNVTNGTSILFVPCLPEEYEIWMGPHLSLNDFKKKYAVNEVYYTKQIAEVLKKHNPGAILTLKGVNTDSGLEAKEATFDGIEEFKVDNEVLFPVIAECRVIKTEIEQCVMRYVAKISSEAHRAVMRKVKPGLVEYQCESVFLDHVYRVGGCRHVSYTCICGTGSNSAVLHYGHAGAPNDKILNDGDMCLFDMGANYYGYAADITCSFPVNGKFTPDQKCIYEAVLRANRAVMNEAKPGTSWVVMHKLANKVILEDLKAGGLLKGSVEEMLENNLGAIFQPHGLGHLIGLDVHDVGGYLPGQPSRPTDSGFNKLRTARILDVGMALTIEPGCYFIDPLLDKAFKDPKLSRFLVREVLERFRHFGGVRIEDDVIMTEKGFENLTVVPRTCEEIERWMAGKDDDKY